MKTILNEYIYQNKNWVIRAIAALILTTTFADYAWSCTSWVATGSATENNETILHRNRDVDKEKQVVILGAGTYKWIGLKDADQPANYPNSGVNEKGLAIVRDDINMAGGINSHTKIEYMLSEHSNINEAKDWLINQNENGIYILADKTGAWIVEMFSGWLYAPKMTQIQSDQIDVYGVANHLKLISGFDYLPFATNHSIIRDRKINEYLNWKKGHITALDSFEWSRKKYSNNNEEGCISNEKTVAATTFVIQDRGPGVDPYVCMWVAMNSPDASIYVPIHMDAVTSDVDISTHLKNSTVSIYDVAQDLYDVLPSQRTCLRNYFLAYEAEMYEYVVNQENNLNSQELQYLDDYVANQAYNIIDASIADGCDSHTLGSNSEPFTDTFPTTSKSNWATNNWIVTSPYYYSQPYSIRARKYNMEDLFIKDPIFVPVPALNRSNYIIVEFWLRQNLTDWNDIILLQYQIGDTKYTIENLFSEQSGFAKYEFVIVDKNYFDIDNFKIGFQVTGLSQDIYGYYETVYVDDVKVKLGNGNLFNAPGEN